MPIFSNVDGIWREVKNIYDNVGGVWKTTRAVHDNVEGTWRESYRKSVFEDYFTPFNASTEYLNGTFKNENRGDHLYSEIEGVAMGGDTKPIQVGWKISNIPPGHTVVIEWEATKGTYAQNDVVATSNGQQLEVFTNTFGRKTTQFNPSGTMELFWNFWTPDQTKSFFKIYSVEIGGVQKYPTIQ